jgi:hypothetical protein
VLTPPGVGGDLFGHGDEFLDDLGEMRCWLTYRRISSISRLGWLAAGPRCAGGTAHRLLDQPPQRLDGQVRALGLAQPLQVRLVQVGEVGPFDAGCAKMSLTPPASMMPAVTA